MAWYKNNAFYSCKIHGQQHSLPVVLAITRHSMTDLLILRPEETIRSSALTSSELQASKFYLQTQSHQDSSPTRALTHIETHGDPTSIFLFFFFTKSYSPPLPQMLSFSFHSLVLVLLPLLCYSLPSHPILPSCEGRGPKSFHLCIFTVSSLYWKTFSATLLIFVALFLFTR